jgi:O-antigen/teichoic acid export membrane protein
MNPPPVAPSMDAAPPYDDDATLVSGGDGKSHIEALARGGLLKVMGGFLNGIFVFVVAIVLTRWLGPAGSGAFFGALALMTILETAAGLGTDVGAVRAVSRVLAVGNIKDLRTTLKIAYVPVLITTIVGGALMFVFAHPFAEAFGGGERPAEIARYVRILALFLPLSVSLEMLMSVTRGFGTMKPDAYLDKILKAGLQLALVALMAVTGAGVFGLALAWGFPIALSFVLAALWTRRLLRRAESRIRARVEGEEALPPRAPKDISREFWRFSAPRALSSVFKVGIDRMAIILVGALAGLTSAGIYTASLRYLAAGQFASLAIMQSMAPKISEFLAAKRTDEARSVYQVSSAWSMVLTWPVYLTLAGFAPLILRLSFGPAFVAGSTAMMIVAGAMLLSTAFGPVTVVLLMGGKSSLNLYNTLAALTVNIALTLLLMKIFHLGLAGAALAWFFSIAVNNLLPLRQVWKHLRLHPFGRGVRCAFIAATVSFGLVGILVRLVLGMSLPAFAVYAAVAGPMYLAFLWRYRDALELSSLKSVLKAGGRGARQKAAAQQPA